MWHFFPISLNRHNFTLLAKRDGGNNGGGEGKNICKCFFSTRGINFVSHERTRASKSKTFARVHVRMCVHTCTHRATRHETGRGGERRRTWDAIVWASGTCPWLQESAMSYTPTYRMPRRRNAPLAPAGFTCGFPEGEGEGEGEGERWNGVRGNPTLRRSLTRRPSRRKLRACARQWPSDPVSFSLESPLLYRQRLRILANPQDPACIVGFAKNCPANFFSPLFLHSNAQLSKSSLFSLLMKVVIFRMKIIN